LKGLVVILLLLVLTACNEHKDLKPIKAEPAIVISSLNYDENIIQEQFGYSYIFNRQNLTEIDGETTLILNGTIYVAKAENQVIGEVSCERLSAKVWIGENIYSESPVNYVAVPQSESVIPFEIKVIVPEMSQTNESKCYLSFEAVKGKYTETKNFNLIYR
jgi:hypothetical protein